MGKKIITGYLVFCGIFVAALLAIIAVRMVTTWDRNLAKASGSFEKLRNAAYSAFLASDGFDSESFLKPIRALTAREQRLILLSIYSRQEGILYLNAESRAFVDPAAGAWDGRPLYRSLPLGSKTLTLALSALPAPDLSVDGVYVLIGKGDVFPIVKDTFIMLFIFLAATTLVMLILPREGAARKPAPEPQREPATQPIPTAKPRPARRRKSGVEGLLPEVDAKNLFSPETGLGWKDHLPQRLKFELDRAAAFDQDLTLALITIDSLAQMANPRQTYARAARMLLEEFTFQDLIFEYGMGSYAVILPDTDVVKGVENWESFQSRLSKSKQFESRLGLSVGLSSRNGRLLNGATLLAEASNALKRALTDPDNAIIAFKADAQKYRELIGQKS